MLSKRSCLDARVLSCKSWRPNFAKRAHGLLGRCMASTSHLGECKSSNDVVLKGMDNRITAKGPKGVSHSRTLSLDAPWLAITINCVSATLSEAPLLLSPLLFFQLDSPFHHALWLPLQLGLALLPPPPLVSLGTTSFESPTPRILRDTRPTFKASLRRSESAIAA